jgi:hypothetical protein
MQEDEETEDVPTKLNNICILLFYSDVFYFWSNVVGSPTISVVTNFV